MRNLIPSKIYNCNHGREVLMARYCRTKTKVSEGTSNYKATLDIVRALERETSFLYEWNFGMVSLANHIWDHSVPGKVFKEDGFPPHCIIVTEHWPVYDQKKKDLDPSVHAFILMDRAQKEFIISDTYRVVEETKLPGNSSNDVKQLKRWLAITSP